MEGATRKDGYLYKERQKTSSVIRLVGIVKGTSLVSRLSTK